MDKIFIFDTTLRDGEQSPGASMNMDEKVKIAKSLDRLGVDIIEAGFAAASKGDFEAIKRISHSVQNSRVCSLARALPNDIETAAKALEGAVNKRIHTFIATSPIHMEHKLKMSPETVIKKAIDAVNLAKSFVEDVEFSCEDAGRSEIGFLKEIIDAAIEAGATTINIPDTVGYRLPHEMGALIKELHSFVQDRAIISVHCHNDLGLATANSIYSIENGARQVECTINGLGERAGNAALEEVVMILKTRKDLFESFETSINTKEIYPTSRLVATVTGIEPQPNKAIVGKNAFAHESGIHQDGVLKHQETYEIIKAQDIGLDKNSIVLGKHSGRHAFKQKVLELGLEVDEARLDSVFERFKALCDKKKEIYVEDIYMLVSDESGREGEIYRIESMQLSDCTDGVPFAAIKMYKNDEEVMDAAIGNGSVDAIFKTIDRVSGHNGKLQDYKVDAVTKGKDALAKVLVKVVFDDSKPAVLGHGLHLDTILASANAYVNALNNFYSLKNYIGKSEDGEGI
ncbi:MAG: 2-isopropylmalate synthase [Campylobacterales bacterium]